MTDELNRNEIPQVTSFRKQKYRDVGTPGDLVKNWFYKLETSAGVLFSELSFVIGTLTEAFPPIAPPPFYRQLANEIFLKPELGYLVPVVEAVGRF